MAWRRWGLPRYPLCLFLLPEQVLSRSLFPSQGLASLNRGAELSWTSHLFSLPSREICSFPGCCTESFGSLWKSREWPSQRSEVRNAKKGRNGNSTSGHHTPLATRCLCSLPDSGLGLNASPSPRRPPLSTNPSGVCLHHLSHALCLVPGLIFATEFLSCEFDLIWKKVFVDVFKLRICRGHQLGLSEKALYPTATRVALWTSVQRRDRGRTQGRGQGHVRTATETRLPPPNPRVAWSH